jgi:hypothetical protein
LYRLIGNVLAVLWAIAIVIIPHEQQHPVVPAEVPQQQHQVIPSEAPQQQQQHQVIPSEAPQQQQAAHGQLPLPEDDAGLPMTAERAAFDEQYKQLDRKHTHPKVLYRERSHSQQQ